MVDLRIENLDIEERQFTDKGEWYCYLDFNLSIPVKRFKVFNHRISLTGYRIMLMVCSDNIKVKPSSADVQQSDFDEALRLPEYDETAIKTYIEEKIEQASHEENFDDSLAFLARFFYIDE